MAYPKKNRLGGHKWAGLLLLILVLSLAWVSACRQGPGKAVSVDKLPPLSFKYIDGHNHLFGHGGPGGGGNVTDYEGAGQTAVEAMEQLGVEKMIIMPPPFIASQGRDVYDCEAFVDVVRRQPRRFAFLAGGGTLNVMIHQAVRDGQAGPDVITAFQAKAEELLAKGAIGFGELAAEHFSMRPGHPNESAPPDHPLFLKLADIAARGDVPVDIHMEAIPEGLTSSGSQGRIPSTSRPNMAAFERLLAHNRQARIIWAHAGWCHTGYRTPTLCADLFKRHPNLCMSIKIGPDSLAETNPLTQDGQLKPEWLNLFKAYPDRLVIGTDQFYYSPFIQQRTPPRTGLTRVLLAQLPPEIAYKIGVETPKILFRL